MIEEYNLTDQLRERGNLHTLAYTRAIEGRRKINQDPTQFKEGYTDEHVFQLYGPRRGPDMKPPEELVPK